MADGLNEARALRVIEIMNDFRTLQIHILQLRLNLPTGEGFEEGHVLMTQCVGEAQSLLNQQYNVQQTQASSSEGDVEKAQLQWVICDASVRRFRAHRIYLKMSAARRWMMGRAQVLQGQKVTPLHTVDLQAVSWNLHNDLAAITNSQIHCDLQSADTRAGHWLADDPSLSIILNCIGSET
ncbi:uncharacterized protein PADG_00614 [Paracoccidioides brasiliensis Pb18]|uniref:Uncharacterized protein n=1 Tax=Paracoccidioides brasiliensis (strain Pb18) TaxID=502780 RepID=C1G174_PARBD|nr:uncharacterized protein PADG_00614 [Paracoccidioides brasiliensis Pb18]EEH44325.2 hypothetical protein PADG_00614 [Paracoccidioides brasiliensis Pb18]